MEKRKKVIIVFGVLLLITSLAGLLIFKSSNISKVEEQEKVLSENFEIAKDKKKNIDDEMNDIWTNNELISITTSTGNYWFGIDITKENMEVMKRHREELTILIKKMNNIDAELIKKQNNYGELLKEYNETNRMLKYYHGMTYMFGDDVLMPSEISDSNDMVEITDSYVDKNKKCSEDTMKNKDTLDNKFMVWEEKDKND